MIALYLVSVFGAYPCVHGGLGLPLTLLQGVHVDSRIHGGNIFASGLG